MVGQCHTPNPNRRTVSFIDAEVPEEGGDAACVTEVLETSGTANTVASKEFKNI